VSRVVENLEAMAPALLFLLASVPLSSRWRWRSCLSSSPASPRRSSRSRTWPRW